MGIFGAMTTAVSGLRSQAYALENISGNIANSQTTAFKRTDTSFTDLLQDNIPSKQIAGNTVASSRQTNTVQGDVQNASVPTYMAINGGGFFVVQKPDSFADGRPNFLNCRWVQSRRRTCRSNSSFPGATTSSSRYFSRNSFSLGLSKESNVYRFV